jgi:cobalamin biosynthesis protein CobC
LEHQRDHGGNLDAAVARFGGQVQDWIDLSTGINRLPYPMGDIPAQIWQRLPTQADMAGVLAAAGQFYGAHAPSMLCAGAQAAIQMIPQLRPRGRAAVIAPSYNEHGAAFRSAGWDVTEVADLDGLRGADIAVIVNPNNPDGRLFCPADLRALAQHVGLLIVDESFGDLTPDYSMLPSLDAGNILVLRSFGKFWGLAGARLGLVYGPAPEITLLRDLAGPWPVSGPALHIASAAYQDRPWAKATRARLAQDAQRMDTLALRAGWTLAGGCDLFRLYNTPDALAAQTHLARHQIWSRIFPYSPIWLRLGPAGQAQEWQRLEAALAEVSG